jgi:hypothetical protein
MKKSTAYRSHSGLLRGMKGEETGEWIYTHVRGSSSTALIFWSREDFGHLIVAM